MPYLCPRHTLHWSFLVCIYMAMFCIFISLSKTCLDNRSFPLELQYSWNALFRCVHEVITVSRYNFCESFRQLCEGSLVNDSRNYLAIGTFSLLSAPVFLCCFLDDGACVHSMNTRARTHACTHTHISYLLYIYLQTDRWKRGHTGRNQSHSVVISKKSNSESVASFE